MKTKERIFYYDFLRTFAIIGVIICHMGIFHGSMSLHLRIANLVLVDVGLIGVPIFLLISGALLLNRDYDLSNFLKRRFSRIVYPYIFWMALICIGLLLFKSSYGFIWSVITGDFSVGWYFWVLIGIYLFIPILNSFIKEFGEKGLKYFLIIWLVTIFLSMIGRYPLFTYFDLNYFAGYVGYPILGYYLINKEFKLSDKSVFIFSAVVFIIFFVIFDYCHFYNIGLIEDRYLNLFMIFISSSFLLMVRMINNITSFDMIKNNVVGKLITSISVHSYGMYFSHVIVLKVLSLINPHSNLLVPIFFILMIVLSWLLVFIVDHIPYLKRFSGV